MSSVMQDYKIVWDAVRSQSRSLDEVTELNLIGKGLGHFPAELLGKMKNLVWLNLSDNQLACLPDFSAQENLQTLYLGRNRIRAVCVDELKPLVQLERLFFCENQLEELPEEIPLRRLERLDLQDNQIASVASASLKQFVKLRHFDLSRNRIRSLEEGLFDGLEELKELHLSGNRLSAIGDDFFKRNTQLNTVNLACNALKRVPVFSLPRLGRLDLHGNHIAVVDAGDFGGMPRLEYLCLRGNPLLRVSFPSDVWTDLKSTALPL